VQGHQGNLVIGKKSGKVVACMQGRYHFYEGHEMEEVVFPIRAFKIMNIKILILTNAAGGINKELLNVGDFMIITDHICMVRNPLIGKNDERFGPRFPDMSNAYD